MARVTRPTSAADRAVAGLATLVVTASVTVRLALLGRASYWGDELFSATQAAGSFRAMTDAGATEIHPPLYAVLLWAWVRVGGPGEAWTRLASTLAAVAAVVVTHRGLRGAGLDGPVRWAATTATAAGGTSVVYSLETRSYALLLLGATGLTAATVRVAAILRTAAATGTGGPVPRRAVLVWAAWGVTAATVHLFGAVLTVAAVVVLAVTIAAGPPPGRGRRAAGWAALGAAVCIPQAGWLLLGIARPGFASGTRWITAPGPADAWALLTTTFGAGGMAPRSDGFAWTSPFGVAAAAALVLAAAAYGARTRGRARPADGSPAADGRCAADGSPAAGSAEGRAAVVLLGLAGLVTGPVFAVSQHTHLWTLRNLLVVVPALTWGVICLAAAAARTASGRRTVAAAAVTLLGAGLVPVAAGVAAPYKTDFRGLVEYLVAVRARTPDATFVFFRPDPRPEWRVAVDPPPAAPVWRGIFVRSTGYPAGAVDAVPRLPGTQVVILHSGIADAGLDARVARLVARLGPGCHRVPLHGLGVIRCDSR